MFNFIFFHGDDKCCSFKISVHPPALLDHLNTRKLSPHFFDYIWWMDIQPTMDWKIVAHNPDYNYIIFLYNSTHYNL